MSFFRNQFRIESARLPDWDYSAPGAYFITICTKNRARLFGDVIRGNMVLNDAGKIVQDEWLKSFAIRAELTPDAFCVMPNHIHGIVFIEPNSMVETHGRASLPFASLPFASLPFASLPFASLPSASPQVGKKMPNRKPKSISSFVAGFKSASTSQINRLYGTPRRPVWQPRFYDHIIRDERALAAIRQYIHNNPADWVKDDYFEPEGGP